MDGFSSKILDQLWDCRCRQPCNASLNPKDLTYEAFTSNRRSRQIRNTAGARHGSGRSRGDSISQAPSGRHHHRAGDGRNSQTNLRCAQSFSIRVLENSSKEWRAAEADATRMGVGAVSESRSRDLSRCAQRHAGLSRWTGVDSRTGSRARDTPRNRRILAQASSARAAG